MDSSSGPRDVASLPGTVAGDHDSSSDEGDEEFVDDAQLSTYNDYVRASLEQYRTNARV